MQIDSYLNWRNHTDQVIPKLNVACYMVRGFGGLGVACWPLVPQVRGFKPGRSRRIFRAKKSSARLPSEGK